MARQSTRKGDAEAEKDETQAASTAAEEKTPEQALEEKLELDRFVERLRSKFH